MKPFVAIGLTTYQDIRASAYAHQLYKAYENHLPTYVPESVNHWNVKATISNESEFANNWHTEFPFKVIENRGRGQTLDKGNFQIGAEWKRPRYGGGKVDFRPENQNDRATTIKIKHPYRVTSDWLDFFTETVKIFSPSYAMMHLFIEEEIKASTDSYLNDFKGPIAGEGLFVSWVSNLGMVRRPDRFDRAGLRTYRFLPELSWANYLAREFWSSVDFDQLKKSATRFQDIADGYIFTVTDDMRDVQKKRSKFLEERTELRSAFPAECFRV